MSCRHARTLWLSGALVAVLLAVLAGRASANTAPGSSRRAFLRNAGSCGAVAVVGLGGGFRNGGRLGLELPGERAGCRTYHYMGERCEAGQFTHWAMDCMTCHLGHT